MIPDLVHFVFTNSVKYGGKPFSLAHYLAIKSVYAINNPGRIYFHYQNEPEGEWWEKIKPVLTLNKVDLPETIFGNTLLNTAHQADVLRLQILYETGGIYLDLDTISVQPYANLLNYDFVMGLQYEGLVLYTMMDKIRYSIKKTFLSRFVELRTPKIRGLANTVILAKPKSDFISLWLNQYKFFRGGTDHQYWDEHSVRVPYLLAKQHPKLITILHPACFYLPSFDDKGLKLMFEKVHDFPNAIIHHLWQHVSWEKYCEPLTVEYIRSKDTTYNLIARRFLKGV